jgi:7 transmembrane receptor (rhodopsin family)
LQVGFAMPYDFALFFIYYEKDPVNSFGMFIIVCLLSIIPILLSCAASILHLIAIAVDRYLSIKYPLEHKVQLTKR